MEDVSVQGGGGGGRTGGEEEACGRGGVGGGREQSGGRRRGPRVPREGGVVDVRLGEGVHGGVRPGAIEAVNVFRGGSFLGAAKYGGGNRPAARQFRERGLGTDDIGFRLVDNGKAGPGQ